MDTDLMGQIPIFAKLGQEQLVELASLLKRVEVPAHQPIFWIGDNGSDFHIVQVGKVALTYPDETGREVTLAELGGGDFFGEISLLDGGARTATARATMDTVLLVLNRHDFLQFLMRHPAAAIHIISILAQRQRETLDKLRGVVNPNTVVEDKMTFGQKVADGFAGVMGSWTFIIVQSAILAFWVTINALAVLGKIHWDEYPFVFLNLALSFQAAYAAPIIMMSQNRQGEKDRIKADLDYQVNLKAQHEIMQLHQKIDHLTTALLAAGRPAVAGNGDRAEALSDRGV